MNESVIEQFKAYKKQVITSYAMILETLIEIQNNTLWKKNKDFESIAQGVSDFFVESYYFDNNINRNNPLEYYNDNINTVLISIMDYYKKENNPQLVFEKKNEIFLISVIICVASYIDIASNVIDGNYLVMKNNLKLLLTHLSKNEELKVFVNNKIIFNNLCELVKKNIIKEKKFFDYFKNSKWHNEYQITCTDPLYYRVRFMYKIHGLEKENKKIVERFRFNFLTTYLGISYELLEVLLIKEFIMNKDVNVYLVPVVDKVEDKLKVLSNPLFKNNIKLLMPIEKYGSEPEGFKVVYSYYGNDTNTFYDKKDLEVLVTKSFKEQNKDKIKDLEDRGIKLIEENIGKSVTENVICNNKEEVK